VSESSRTCGGQALNAEHFARADRQRTHLQRPEAADRAMSSHLEPGSITMAAIPAEPSAAALVDALDGCDRKILLGHLARTSPALVDAGIAWMAEYHAANRERRWTIRNRKSEARRQRLGQQLPECK
jgi:hypothetical protein